MALLRTSEMSVTFGVPADYLLDLSEDPDLDGPALIEATIASG